jgi:hypothetical protein
MEENEDEYWFNDSVQRDTLSLWQKQPSKTGKFSNITDKLSVSAKLTTFIKISSGHSSIIKLIF